MTTLDSIVDELLKEIETRKSLMKDMVGSLYPSILADEIEKLQKAVKELTW